jgi:hypothetical protein
MPRLRAEEATMRQTTLRLPDLMLLVGTRVALGVGIGLLLGTRLDKRARKGAGIALLAMGVLTTVPILLNVRGTQRMLGSESAAEARGSMGLGSERRGAGAVRDTPMQP